MGFADGSLDALMGTVADVMLSCYDGDQDDGHDCQWGAHGLLPDVG